MTRPVQASKPHKPYPTFPLTPHPSGQWAKKIRGRTYYFGPWSDPQSALESYHKQAADLHAGRQPTIPTGGVTVKQLVNAYLGHQQDKVASGEIGIRHFDDCRRTLSDWAKFFGEATAVADIRPDGFARYRNRLAKRLGVRSLAKNIIAIKGMFNYAFDVGLIDQPPKFSRVFAPPAANVIRRTQRQEEAANGKKLFKPEEVLALIDPPADHDVVTPAFFRPAVLLGINGGFGNTDLATLPLRAVDLEKAVIAYPRSKTGVERVVPLWPETVTAIEKWIASRPRPQDAQHAGLVFLTPQGLPLVRQKVKMSEDGAIDGVINLDRLSHEFNDLLEALSLKRRGLGFYTLRHTFRTWADETRDQHAIHRIMGHTLPGMSGVYVEEIGLNRLRAVADHVRVKLFPGTTAKT